MNEQDPLQPADPGTAERHTPTIGAEEHARRARLESLITSISTELTVVERSRLGASLGHALQRVGEAVEADHAWICRVTADSRRFRVTQEWCADSPSAFSAIDRGPVADQRWLWERIRAGETVAVRDIADLPPEGESARDLFRAVGARSVLAVPLATGARLRGYVGFAGRERPIAGDPDDLALLRFVGDILADALERLEEEPAPEPAEPVASQQEPPDTVDLLRAQREILARLDSEDPGFALEELCKLVEHFVPGMQASIWRISGEGVESELRPVTASSLPEELTGALDGMEPGLDVGPFGQSCDGERVVVEDLMRDPSVQTYREPALAHGLRSCWTLPIRERDAVVGVIAIFGRQPSVPTASEWELLTDVARMAGAALSRGVESAAASAETKPTATLPSIVPTHDFGNLLTAILGHVELGLVGIERGTLREATDLRPTLLEIRRAGERASDLARQLLAGRRESPVNPELVDLNRVVSDSQVLLQRLIGERIRLESALSPALDPVLADPAQLEQLIVNLALNARDSMPDGGRLTFETSNVRLSEEYAAGRADARPGPHVLLRVRDTGHGMSRDTVQRIFEPFFTTKPRGRGTGLGLSIVHDIVSGVGGHIVVNSRPGRGSTFAVCLPAVEDDSAEETPAVSDEPEACRGETVLLCEPDEMVRELAEKVLLSRGYAVLSAAGGAHALQVADRFGGPIDLLLADAASKQPDGPEWVRLLARRRPGVKLLYMSGSGASPAGAPVLEKPFSAEVLLRRVRERLESS